MFIYFIIIIIIIIIICFLKTNMAQKKENHTVMDGIHSAMDLEDSLV